MQEYYTEFKNTPAEFKMIYVEGGVFDMGSDDEEAHDNERPVHKVKIRDFWMGEFAVTQVIWGYIMADTDKSNPSYFKAANRPVENVSWEDINNYFLPKLNKKTEGRRPFGTKYLLPTEADWEYSAKGGKYGQQYSFSYAGSDKLEEVGWYYENSHNESKTVRLKTPNLLGLYDMSGNVWEWCRDWYSEEVYRIVAEEVLENPLGSATGLFRVRRGGSRLSNMRDCRSTDRGKSSSENSSSGVGFRLVLSFSPVQ